MFSSVSSNCNLQDVQVPEPKQAMFQNEHSPASEPKTKHRVHETSKQPNSMFPQFPGTYRLQFAYSSTFRSRDSRARVHARGCIQHKPRRQRQRNVQARRKTK